MSRGRTFQAEEMENRRALRWEWDVIKGASVSMTYKWEERGGVVRWLRPDHTRPSESCEGLYFYDEKSLNKEILCLWSPRGENHLSCNPVKYKLWLTVNYLHYLFFWALEYEDFWLFPNVQVLPEFLPLPANEERGL